ncbi:MAG: nucleotide exchange factor GrpE [Fibrobacterales bacterium]
MTKEKETTEPIDQEVETTEEIDSAVESEPSEESESPNEETTEEESPTEETGSKSIEQLTEELDKANDKHLRLHAEFDNYRRRTAKESLTLVATANANLISKQCDILDNFDRAFVEENKAPDLESFEKGMKMIQEQFFTILEDAGLETIDPVNTVFNPEEHEALMQQPSDDIDEGSVLTVFQKGYKLKEKVLRHAKVIVSSGPAEAAAE